MAFIKKLKDVNENTIYPQTHTEAVYDASGVHLQSWMDRYVTAEEIGEKEEIDINFENQENKVTVIDENSTNIQYPSAKATYDLIVNNLSNLEVGIKIEVVNVLPAIANADSQSIYLVPAETSEDENIYNEYLLVNNAWEHLGTTKVDLSNYYTKTEADSKYAKLSKYSDTTINIGRNPNTTVGLYSVAEGGNTTASGIYSHAEGYNAQASGNNSHAEGWDVTASGEASHAEGYSTEASGDYSHAEGNDTICFGSCSHAEGYNTQAGSHAAHAEGSDTTASGNASHAEGVGTTASGHYSHAEGKYNIVSTSYAHIVGNGSSNTKRSNAHTLDWYGNAWFEGDVYVGSTSGTNKDEGSKKLATEEYVNNKTNGLASQTYVLDSIKNDTSKVLVNHVVATAGTNVSIPNVVLQQDTDYVISFCNLSDRVAGNGEGSLTISIGGASIYDSGNDDGWGEINFRLLGSGKIIYWGFNGNSSFSNMVASDSGAVTYTPANSYTLTMTSGRANSILVGSYIKLIKKW